MSKTGIVVLTKDVDFDRISLTAISDTNRKISQELEEKSRLEWESVLDDAKSKGMNIWDGKYYRLENYDEIKNGSLDYVISPTSSYSQIRTFQKLKVSENYPTEYHSLHISTLALTYTKDGCVIFGYRNKTQNSNSYTPIGGGLQPDELEVKSADDVYENILKELKEETNVDSKHVINREFLGVLHSIERMNLYFYFKLELDLSHNEVEAIFLEEENSEHDKLEFIKISEIDEFLKDKPPYLQEAFKL